MTPDLELLRFTTISVLTDFPERKRHSKATSKYPYDVLNSSGCIFEAGAEIDKYLNLRDDDSPQGIVKHNKFKAA